MQGRRVGMICLAVQHAQTYFQLHVGNAPVPVELWYSWFQNESGCGASGYAAAQTSADCCACANQGIMHAAVASTFSISTSVCSSGTQLGHV